MKTLELEDILEKHVQLKYKIYERLLKTVESEKLENEYNDRIGLGYKDAGKMINELLDWYSNCLFDDPNFDAFDVNDIYFLGEL